MILQARFGQQLQPSTIGKTNGIFHGFPAVQTDPSTFGPLRPEVRLMSCDLEARATADFQTAKVTTHRIHPKNLEKVPEKMCEQTCILCIQSLLFFWTQLFSSGSRFTFNGESYIEFLVCLGNVQFTMDDTSDFFLLHVVKIGYGMELKGWSGYWWFTIRGILEGIPFSKQVSSIFEFLLLFHAVYPFSTFNLSRFPLSSDSKRILFPLEQQNTWSAHVSIDLTFAFCSAEGAIYRNVWKNHM